MTRKSQLWFLIGLSALTATAQYIVQGAMASGGTPELFNLYFWYVDYGLWGLRSLIEAWVIVYLFQTTGKTTAQRWALIIFEATLIVLITLTLGPALYALTTGLHIADTMTIISLRWWTYGVAAYTSLMMGSAGFAYRVQPISEDAKLIATDDYEKLQSRNTELEQQAISLNETVQIHNSTIDQLSDSQKEFEDVQIRLKEVTKLADKLQSRTKKLETAKEQLEYELQHIDQSIQPVMIGRAIKAVLKQHLNGDFDYANLDIPREIAKELNTRPTPVVRGWNQKR